jgi:hypothetical protein
MSTLSGASARLRRTFDYPSDDDDGHDGPSDARQAAMDEEGVHYTTPHYTFFH